MHSVSTWYIYYKALGDLTNVSGALELITPSLDVIRSRPADAAHSEYQGLAKFLMTLIFEKPGILTAKALDKFQPAFSSFTFPPGWRRLESPTKHLKSMRMQELARAAIIIPVFFRVWLLEEYVKPEMRCIMVQLAKDYFNPQCFSSYDTRNFRSVQWLTAACWMFAKSILYTCGPFSYAQLNDFDAVVIRGRRAIQFLVQVCINSSRVKKGTFHHILIFPMISQS